MIIPFTPQSISSVLDKIHSGEVIGLPTETVYGLAADAFNEKAVARIYELKNRPHFNPLIVHGARKDAFQDHVIWTDAAETLAKAFWPGPLTLVLRRTPASPLSLLLSSGLETVAIRVPSHPVAQEVLTSLDGLLAAPSANLSGKVSPTNAHHVEEDFPNILTLEGGASPIGLESTIIDLSTPHPTLLRTGKITQTEIEDLLGPLSLSKGQIKAPGMMKSHYATSLPLRLNASAPQDGEAFLAFGETTLEGPSILNLSSQGDVAEAAANLFKMLRLLDQPTYRGLAVSPIPLKGLGLAINDRLQRAAAPRDI